MNYLVFHGCSVLQRLTDQFLCLRDSFKLNLSFPDLFAKRIVNFFLKMASSHPFIISRLHPRGSVFFALLSTAVSHLLYIAMQIKLFFGRKLWLWESAFLSLFKSGVWLAKSAWNRKKNPKADRQEARGLILTGQHECRGERWSPTTTTTKHKHAKDTMRHRCKQLGEERKTTGESANQRRDRTGQEVWSKTRQGRKQSPSK